MIIRQSGDVWFAEASFEERHALKAAGFWWHGNRCRPNCGACQAGLGRVWWTPHRRVASKLAHCAEDGCQDDLQALQEARAVVVTGLPNLERTARALDEYDAARASGDHVARESAARAVGAAFADDTADRNQRSTALMVAPRDPWLRGLVARWRAEVADR